jgi:hypothetical protein
MGDGKWLNCRLADIEDRLDEQGHKVSLPVISRLLRAHDYRLRANVKELVGKQDPERDVQFQHILAQRSEHKSDGQPTLSVDTKKKELIGNFKNPGRAWGRESEEVDVHDFPQDAVGRAVPYGLYDTSRTEARSMSGNRPIHPPSLWITLCAGARLNDWLITQRPLGC